jgi:hypothetical protein
MAAVVFLCVGGNKRHLNCVQMSPDSFIVSKATSLF